LFLYLVWIALDRVHNGLLSLRAELEKQEMSQTAKRSGKWSRISAAMLRIVRNGGGYPGKSALAEKLRCSLPTIQKAIKSSQLLMDWQAEACEARRHGTAENARWPDIQEKLKQIMRRGEPYPGTPVLAERLSRSKRLRCSNGCVQTAIDRDESGSLRKWQADGQGAGGRAAMYRRVQAELIGMVRQNKPYPGVRALAKGCGCRDCTIAKAIETEPTGCLREWEAEGRKGENFRHGPPPKKRLRIQRVLRGKVERGEPYTSLEKLGKEHRCSMWTIIHAIKHDPILKDWRDKLWEGRGRRCGPSLTKRPKIVAKLLAMIEDGEPYPGLGVLAGRFCSRGAVRQAIKSDDRLRDWQRDAWKRWPAKFSRHRGPEPKKRRAAARILDRLMKAGKPCLSFASLAAKSGLKVGPFYRAVHEDPERMEWWERTRRDTRFKPKGRTETAAAAPERPAAETAPPAPVPPAEAVAPGASVPRRGRRDGKWLADAMLSVRDHPDWSDAKVADCAGVSPSTLCRSEIYRKAADLARHHGRPAKGHKTADGDVEAYDQDGDPADRTAE